MRLPRIASRVRASGARRSIISSFFFQAEDGIRDKLVTGVQTCAPPILSPVPARPAAAGTGLTGASPAPRPTSPPNVLAAAPSPHGVLAETAPAGRELGFYIHMPFCAKRCYYCSFNTAPMDAGAMLRYLGALHREVELLSTLPWAGDA